MKLNALEYKNSLREIIACEKLQSQHLDDDELFTVELPWLIWNDKAVDETIITIAKLLKDWFLSGDEMSMKFILEKIVPSLVSFGQNSLSKERGRKREMLLRDWPSEMVQQWVYWDSF